MGLEQGNEAVPTNQCYCGPIVGSLIDHLRTEHPADCVGECRRCHQMADLSEGAWAYCPPCVVAIKAAKAIEDGGAR